MMRRVEILVLALPFALVFYWHAGKSIHVPAQQLPSFNERGRIATLVSALSRLQHQNELLRKENAVLKAASDAAAATAALRPDDAAANPSRREARSTGATGSVFQRVPSVFGLDATVHVGGSFLLATESTSLPANVPPGRLLRSLVGMSIALNRTLVVPSTLGGRSVATASLPEALRGSHVRVRIRHDGEGGILDDALKHALRAYADTKILEVEDVFHAFCGFRMNTATSRSDSDRYSAIVATIEADGNLEPCTSSPKEAEVVWSKNLGMAGRVHTVTVRHGQRIFSV